MRRASVVLVVAAIAAAGAACGDDGSARSARPTSTTAPAAATPGGTVLAGAATALPDGDDAVVRSVTDGDTIRVTASGTDERVRLIGIDTPETHDPRTVVECFGREASARTAALLPPGTRVRLVRDVEARDRYGRRLAYVYRADDGLFVNEDLVAGGWAVPYRYPPNVRFADAFSTLGRQAREQGVGLWGACGGADTPASGTGASPATTAPPAGDPGACDANYAGACVPVSSTDLDCGDVGARRFEVVGADPHGFDGDHDGIACE